MSESDQHKYCTNKFIELANELRHEEIDSTLVSGALMTASAIYATFVAAGNDGALEPAGVERIVELYKRTLEHHQNLKRTQIVTGTH